MAKVITKSKMASFFLYVLVVVVVVYIGFGVVLYLMQPKFLYRPTRDVVYTPRELGMDFEEASIETSDGVRLHGWYIPAEDSRYTVLFCHGNGGNIMHRLDSVNMLNNMGLSCLVFDYRGYGKSEGRPTEEGTYLDVTAAHEWLAEHKGVAPENLIVMGRSLGGAIAAHLASKVECRSLVLESTFTSYADIGRKFYPYMPVRWFARFKYPTIEFVKQAKCPILLVHSRVDELIPFEFGLELYEAAGEPKEFVEVSGSHNDYFIVSGEAYKQAWLDWLESLDNGVGQQGGPGH